MGYTISKRFDFSASHVLEGLPDDHPCSRLHGHNWRCVVVLEADDLNAVGFVRDYRELSPLKDWLDAEFDHRHLNDKVPFNPTSENLSRYIFERAAALWPEVKEIRISETEKTWCVYRP